VQGDRHHVGDGPQHGRRGRRGVVGGQVGGDLLDGEDHLLQRFERVVAGPQDVVAVERRDVGHGLGGQALVGEAVDHVGGVDVEAAALVLPQGRLDRLHPQQDRHPRCHLTTEDRQLVALQHLQQAGVEQHLGHRATGVVGGRGLASRRARPVGHGDATALGDHHRLVDRDLDAAPLAGSSGHHEGALGFEDGRDLRQHGPAGVSLDPDDVARHERRWRHDGRRGESRSMIGVVNVMPSPRSTSA
jgi:hypothetical protein